MRSRRAAVAITIFLSLLCLASGASVVGTPTPSATPTTGASTHTLVITAQNGSGSYTVTASSQLHLKRGEQTDYQLGGPRVSGTVGERGDAKDVIQYRGHIESFQADGSIRVTLDGHQIAPRVLGGQYIQISRAGNASQPVRYQFGVTGQVSPGARAEQTDTVSAQRIHGRVRDTADSFYFTGTIPNDSITISGPAQIQINGQPAHVFLTHAPPTPSATPTPTPTATPSPPRTPPAPTPVSTSTPVSPPSTSPSPTVTPSSTMTDDGDHAGSPVAGFLVQLVNGVGGTLIIGIAAIVAVLYLFVDE
jgi:hypothetical protein